MECDQENHLYIKKITDSSSQICKNSGKIWGNHRSQPTYASGSILVSRVPFSIFKRVLIWIIHFMVILIINPS